MNWKKYFSTVFLVMVQLFSFVLLAQSAKFPVPSGISNQLFYLQRTPNTNTIVCELNLKNGKLDTQTPIHVFWLRYGDKGQREELDYIQRKFAYGISNRKIAENQYELNFVSYKKYKMYLQLAADGKFHVYTLINKKMCILNKIYIEIKGGTFWVPHVEYVEISGTQPAANQPEIERLKI